MGQPLSNISPQYNLKFHPFNFSWDDQNITLYYGCNISRPQSGPMFPANQFNCIVNETMNWNFYVTGQAGGDCESNIFVPVNRVAARAMVENNSSLNVLRDALASGFSIEWSANNRNCRNCMESGGTCGYNQNSGSFACYCAGQSLRFICDITRGEFSSFHAPTISVKFYQGEDEAESYITFLCHI
ncbi:hypothetical protein RD792_006801 [Penstemon davidsonii]|uniref:Wall-associated receptor kinase C-terminal domain-containing protein n=1 Tax=Penstemon davidsonii TaxID=160366 RepID=A0ABR0DBR6_9LAMI|nr:hypothetical protein RD792_006801 [Penstemon davidsonii]